MVTAAALPFVLPPPTLEIAERRGEVRLYFAAMPWTKCAEIDAYWRLFLASKEIYEQTLDSVDADAMARCWVQFVNAVQTGPRGQLG